MRKPIKNLDIIKQEIMKLKGLNIEMEVNKGRKKIVHYEGIVENIYNSVFVVRVVNDVRETLSYSFSDVLCGDVKIAIKK
ncbi:MAG: Veg family protein [Clostridia bacterium]|nr:Veg family protein [Clostridia bacterium]